MELVDKNWIQKSWILNDKCIKELEIFVYGMAQPPWKSLTNMVSGIESDLPRKHNAWNGAQERWI
jgi:hypothetical protein